MKLLKRASVGAMLLVSLLGPVSGEAGSSSLCPEVPGLTDCVTAVTYVFRIQGGDPAKSKLQWKWLRGNILALGAIGDRSTDSDYALCIYDGVAGVYTLATELTIPAGPLWTASGKGWIYKDATVANDGVAKIVLTAGAEDPGKSNRAMLKATGPGIPLPTPISDSAMFHDDPLVLVELRKVSGTGGDTCWTSDFPVTKANTSDVVQGGHEVDPSCARGADPATDESPGRTCVDVS